MLLKPNRFNFQDYLWLVVVYFVIIWLFTLTSKAKGQENIQPEWAVVRIKSHGASGVVIQSTQGKSFILSCAHMFDSNESLFRKIEVDGWNQPNAPKLQAKAALKRLNKNLDLSLIELSNGPFYYLPIAPQGYKPNQNLTSLGYDAMKWPAAKKTATYLGKVKINNATTILTREPPWHGRSGGALVDPTHNYLVGIVQAYEHPYPYGRGMYVSLESIQGFLNNPINASPRPLSPLEPNPFCPPQY